MEPEAPPMERESPKTPEHTDKATFKNNTFGRGRLKLIRERTSPDSLQSGPDKIPAPDVNTGALTISTDHMTETEVPQAIQVAKCADEDFLYRRRKR